MDQRDELVAVAIVGAQEGGGVVDLPHEVGVAARGPRGRRS